MYVAKYFAVSESVYLFQKNTPILLILLGFIGPFLISHSSYALTPNPGATCQDIGGASQDKLTDSDYTNLLASISNKNYFDVAGNAAGSIPLQMRMDLTESSTSNINDNFSIIGASQYKLINIGRNFPNPTASTDITLSFRNKTTQQPIYLTNVAISAFDVDYSNTSNSLFDDYVRITGITQSGSVVDGTIQTIVGSNVIYSKGLNNSTNFNCASRDLDTRCQGSIQFSQAVSAVTIHYTNNPAYVSSNPTSQEIQLRVDNYCYIPQYIFSGTVFDDNGGITAAQASATNTDIISSGSPYSNKPNFFNGIFNPPQEAGITGSTVKLVNCTNTSTVYPTQSVIRSDAPVGEYQISIPTTTLNSNTNLCLLETRTGTTYPIRTNTDKKNLSFVASTYNYPNNNFGRVIAENVALVLTKYQYINNCPSTLDYTGISESTTPITGFSTASIDKIEPGQCIAYKITATNRANVSIDNFVMQDRLQKSGVNNATATSVLANPALDLADYDSGSPAIGQNGTIKTRTLVLNPRTKRDFYFNTKYGTTMNPQ